MGSKFKNLTLFKRIKALLRFGLFVLSEWKTWMKNHNKIEHFWFSRSNIKYVCLLNIPHEIWRAICYHLNDSGKPKD